MTGHARPAAAARRSAWWIALPLCLLSSTSAAEPPANEGSLLHALDAPRWQIRASAADELGRRHVTAAAPRLSALIDDDSRAVRSAAVMSLGRLGVLSELPAVRQIVDKSHDNQVVVLALFTLAELTSREAGVPAQEDVGRAAVFCRFAGCNLWSGLEKDRADAICNFCDTDFVGVDGVGGGRLANAQFLADAIDAHWPNGEPSRVSGRVDARKFVVCTGGEPLLQMTDEFVRALHERGFEVAIETNGTKLPPAGIDWICVSPKANAELVLRTGNELKLIYPQPGGEPERYARLDFAHFFLQPMDGPERERNTQMAIQYCLQHPQWRLSLQTQKVVGIKCPLFTFSARVAPCER